MNRVDELADLRSLTWRDDEHCTGLSAGRLFTCNLSRRAMTGCAPIIHPPPPTVLSRSARPTSGFQVETRFKHASDPLRPLHTFDASCRSGELFPRGPDTDINNRQPAIGSTRTAGILDGKVAMPSFILSLSRP